MILTQEERGLIASMSDDPDDEDLRLIYADWLEDRSDPWAEHFRLEQRHKTVKTSTERSEILKRMAWLARTHFFRKRLVALNHLRKSRKIQRFHAYGGLVMELPVQAKWLIKHGEAIARGYPVVKMCVTGQYANENNLAGSPGLSIASQLDVQVPLSPKDLGELFLCPYLTRLRELSLSGQGLGLIDCGKLTSSPVLSNLRGLSVDTNQLGPVTLQELIQSGSLCLESLNLSDNRIKDEGAQALFRSENLPSLEWLCVSNNGLTDRSLKGIKDSCNLKSLKTLHLNDNSITSVGARSLAFSPWLGQLKHLNLSNNRITALGVEALANSQYLRPEAEIHLWGNHIREILPIRKKYRGRLTC